MDPENQSTHALSGRPYLDDVNVAQRVYQQEPRDLSLNRAVLLYHPGQKRCDTNERRGQMVSCPSGQALVCLVGAFPSKQQLRCVTSAHLLRYPSCSAFALVVPRRQSGW